MDRAIAPLDTFLPLGCLISTFNKESDDLQSLNDWSELFGVTPSTVENLSPKLVKAIQRLLKAKWIRILAKSKDQYVVIRFYILPDDVARATVARGSRSLLAELEQLLPMINTSQEAWAWDGQCLISDAPFQSWATREEGSLFYIFNTLQSPAPNPMDIADRHTRTAVSELLDYNRSLPGLQTSLYPYQARSAAAMIQRESSTKLLVDPRFEKRQAPDGRSFYFSPRDLAFYVHPPMYETGKGGILAEQMGLGKTVICLATILSTKNHLPKIPPQYASQKIREKTPRLLDLCMTVAGNHSLPIKAHFERIERRMGHELLNCHKMADLHEIEYFIPGKKPRSNRKSSTPGPRRMICTSATIVVVPRNLVHQWKSEIKKHITPGSLKVLIVDGSDCEVLPPANELRHYHIILFSKPRFEKEIMDGSDSLGRKAGAQRTTCNCLFYRSGMEEGCICFREENIYHSPLKELLFLRCIIDEGHEFSSSKSNAVLVADRLVKAERRWVVSGTPAKERLYGVEADFALNADYENASTEVNEPEFASLSEPSTPRTEESWGISGQSFKMEALNRRKAFNPQEDIGNSSATKGLSLLISHFLQLRPWYQEEEDAKVSFDEHVYRHEGYRNKTYSGFSACLRQTLQDVVIKTQPDDVERDIQLPPLTVTTVRLDPSFYDKLTANMFVVVLTANAITSERKDADYLWHKNSVKARYSLIHNLRTSNFSWTGFSSADVESAIKTSSEYLKKEDTNCSNEDKQLLEGCIEFAKVVLRSHGWHALSRHHEMGLFVNQFPEDSAKLWAMEKTSEPYMLGAKAVHQAQSFINDQLFTDHPTEGFATAGELATTLMQVTAEEDENDRNKTLSNSGAKKGIPTSAVHSDFGAKKNASATPTKPSRIARKSVLEPASGVVPIPSPAKHPTQSPMAVKKRKREMDTRELPLDSELCKPCIIGTTSAKLTYLLDRIIELQKEEKIIIFYDSDNTAYYLSQCLDVLHVRHLIYAKSLTAAARSRYIVTFDVDQSIRLLLIDIKCGSFGLNINKASRVFFINPPCQQGTERQAIKRAHRIGQTKPVFVETLVLNDTIEAGIFERSRRMTQLEHLEAHHQLSDDKGIAEIIQNARLIPVTLDEGIGERQMARLENPIQLFGRTGRGDMKIKGIDKDLDVVGSSVDISPTKKSRKRQKISSVLSNQSSHDIATTSMSGVEWMNLPIINGPLSNQFSPTKPSMGSIFG